MQRKLRILFSTEFTRLHTGYANYYDQLMRALYRTGKYELFELASYCKGDDPYHQQLMRDVPWRVYPNLPQNDQEQQIYNSNPQMEFGKFRFEQTCLDCQPHIVCSIKDYWMDSYLEESIFRRLFKLVLMPTLDGQPLNNEWLSFYQSCDNILTYTNWSKDLLEEESGGFIKVAGVPSPTADANLFKPPTDRRSHKAKFGLPPDSFIVGMVARNQKRKLYPDIAKSFVEFLQRLNLDGTEKTYLYFHCSYPDVGYDIPEIIKSNGVAHKVLMTYYCHNPACRRWFPSFYQDAATICRYCGQKSAVLSNSQIGIDRQALADVYGLIDLYTQHVLCEGFGLPHMEAAFCGCITAGTDYSGTIDILQKTQSKAIPVKRFYLEAETGRHMALPDNDVLVEYIEEIHRLPESIRYRMSQKTAELARRNFGTWDDVASIWMQVFDSIPIPDSNPWVAPPDIAQTEGLPCPDASRMSDEQFVSWALTEILHRGEWVNSHRGLKLLRDLSWNRTVVNNLGFIANEASQLGMKPTWEIFDRNKLLSMIVQQRRVFNQAEIARKSYIEQGKIRA